MSVSSRDRRVEVYPYSGTNDGGYVTHSYGTSRGTFFARVSPMGGTETTTASQADHREQSLFEFSDAVTVGLDDMLVLDDVQWKVASVYTRRRARQKLVRAYRLDDEADAATS